MTEHEIARLGGGEVMGRCGRWWQGEAGTRQGSPANRRRRKVAAAEFGNSEGWRVNRVSTRPTR